MDTKTNLNVTPQPGQPGQVPARLRGGTDTRCAVPARGRARGAGEEADERRALHLLADRAQVFEKGILPSNECLKHSSPQCFDGSVCPQGTCFNAQFL